MQIGENKSSHASYYFVGKLEENVTNIISVESENEFISRKGVLHGDLELDTLCFYICYMG